MLGFRRSRSASADAPGAPPVVVPADAVRPGEDDRALVRAVAAYVRAMRRDGAWAFREMNADAVRAYAIDDYLGRVERLGHTGYASDPPTPGLVAHCREGLERVAPAFARLHAACLPAGEGPAARADAADLSRLDAAFRAAGGREAADPLVAGLVAAIDVLELVSADRYPARLAEVAAAHPEAEERQRDLRIAELDACLTSPVAAGVGIILARTLAIWPAFELRAHAPGQDADAAQWEVRTGPETFRAARYPDRLVVFRALPDGAGFTGLGHLAHEKIAITCDWAARRHAALAAVLGLERTGAADRLTTVVFDRRKALGRSGAEAASFHLALRGMTDLALVAFPGACAVVDPRDNARLAEIDHEALGREAEAHAGRLATFLD